MPHPLNGLATSSSSSSSSSSIVREQPLNIEPLPYQAPIDPNRTTESLYSRHSTWVHPAIAFQNQLPPTFQNQFPALSWRKGKWTEEEEFYAKKLIDAFNGGYLKVSSGTTLRSFLAERLCCDPMRITKKFAGSSCIGKQVFNGGDCVIDDTKRKEIQEELKALEKNFMSKIDYQHKISYPVPDQSVAFVTAFHPQPYLSRYPIEGGTGHPGHGHRHPHPHPHQLPPGHAAHIQGFPPVYYGIPPPHQHPHPLHHRIGPSSTTSESTSDSAPEAKIRLLRTVADIPLNQGGSYPFAPLIVNIREDPVPGPHPQLAHNPHFVLRHPGHSQSHHPHPHTATIILTAPIPGSAPQLLDGHPSSLVHSLVAPYRQRQAHSSADLFGRQYPTTIEQMNFLSSENLRKKLAADNMMPSNGFHTGGRMGMGDAAKFCSAAAHAYSEKIQLDDVAKRKLEKLEGANSSASESVASTSSAVGSTPHCEKDVRQVDLEASDLLLNFFNAAGTSTTKSKKNEGSVSGSSGSGSTSNQGEQDGDDNSVSNFSDAVDGDVSASVSGRSSSLSSDRSDNNSDIDYSSHDDTEHEQKSVSYSPGPKKRKLPVENPDAKESYNPKPTKSAEDPPFAVKIPRLI